MHGTELIPQESSSVHSSPYGAYPTPSFKHNFPLPHPPRSSKTGKIKKTIMVVNLHKKGKAKKGKVDYTTVTQVVVSMTPAECNVNDVATSVRTSRFSNNSS